MAKSGKQAVIGFYSFKIKIQGRRLCEDKEGEVVMVSDKPQASGTAGTSAWGATGWAYMPSGYYNPLSPPPSPTTSYYTKTPSSAPLGSSTPEGTTAMTTTGEPIPKGVPTQTKISLSTRTPFQPVEVLREDVKVQQKISLSTETPFQTTTVYSWQTPTYSHTYETPQGIVTDVYKEGRNVPIYSEIQPKEDKVFGAGWTQEIQKTEIAGWKPFENQFVSGLIYGMPVAGQALAIASMADIAIEYKKQFLSTSRYGEAWAKETGSKVGLGYISPYYENIYGKGGVSKGIEEVKTHAPEIAIGAISFGFSSTFFKKYITEPTLKSMEERKPTRIDLATTARETEAGIITKSEGEMNVVLKKELDYGKKIRLEIDEKIHLPKLKEINLRDATKNELQFIQTGAKKLSHFTSETYAGAKITLEGVETIGKPLPPSAEAIAITKGNFKSAIGAIKDVGGEIAYKKVALPSGNIMTIIPYEKVTALGGITTQIQSTLIQTKPIITSVAKTTISNLPSLPPITIPQIKTETRITPLQKQIVIQTTSTTQKDSVIQSLIPKIETQTATIQKQPTITIPKIQTMQTQKETVITIPKIHEQEKSIIQTKPVITITSPQITQTEIVRSIPPIQPQKEKPLIPPILPPILPISFGGEIKRIQEYPKGKSQFKYTPSLFASAFNIKAPKINMGKTFKGFEIRPMITGRKRRRK